MQVPVHHCSVSLLEEKLCVLLHSWTLVDDAKQGNLWKRKEQLVKRANKMYEERCIFNYSKYKRSLKPENNTHPGKQDS